MKQRRPGTTDIEGAALSDKTSPGSGKSGEIPAQTGGDAIAED
jgi:hypothetical protein